MPSDNSSNDFLQTGDKLFKEQDFEGAEKSYLKALESSQKEFNLPVEVESLSQIARLNLKSNNLDKAKEWLDKAEQKATKTEPMGWSRFLGVKGRYFWLSDDLKQAKDIFVSMYDNCLENSLTGRAVDAAHMIAIVSKDKSEQIKWSKVGIETAEKYESESWLGPLWNNLAGVYYDEDEFESALDCYIKAREYHWRFSGELAKLFADYHVGMTYRKIGDLNKSSQWLRPLLAWAERIENHSAIGQVTENLGEIEISLGNKELGLDFLKKAREQYQLAGFDKSWTDIWDNISNRISEIE